MKVIIDVHDGQYHITEDRGQGNLIKVVRNTLLGTIDFIRIVLRQEQIRPSAFDTLKIIPMMNLNLRWLEDDLQEAENAKEIW